MSALDSAPWPVEGQRFVDLLREHCQPVVEQAGFPWNGRQSVQPVDGVSSFVFCAAPHPFVEWYPEFTRNYGAEGPRCVDICVHVRWSGREIRADVEGADVVAWLRGNGHGAWADEIEHARLIDVAVERLGRGLAAMLRVPE